MELNFEHLSKSYAKKNALTDINMTLDEGIYGLLGPNGAGKSTLMNLLSGNLLPSAGEILYNGQNISKMGKDFRAKLGYMPQQQTLYPDFTAYRFLSYIAALRGMHKKEAKEKIPWVLDKVGLSEVGMQRIRTFSGGMKQRLLIAQAIIADPQVLILDEPTAGLDPQQRIQIRNMISEIALHKIVLIATHVVSDVENIAKEIIFLKDGTIIRKKTVAQLLEELRGKVFEIVIDETILDAVQKSYSVIRIVKQSDNHILVRILSNKTPLLDGPKKAVDPTLEDVYLYFTDFGGLGQHDTIDMV